MSLTGTLDMLWEDNERLRARVESQQRVIEDVEPALRAGKVQVVEIGRSKQ